MSECADCKAKDAELDELAEAFGHLEDDLNELKDKCADLHVQLADADRENGRLRLALGDIYAKAGEML